MTRGHCWLKFNNQVFFGGAATPEGDFQSVQMHSSPDTELGTSPSRTASSSFLRSPWTEIPSSFNSHDVDRDPLHKYLIIQGQN